VLVSRASFCFVTFYALAYHFIIGYSPLLAYGATHTSKVIPFTLLGGRFQATLVCSCN
jgi:hypothetical protein